MEVSFSKSFKRAFRKKINDAILEDLFWEKVQLFIADPYHLQLKTHKLSGKLKELSSFSVGYDLRIVFYFTKDKPPKAVFVDLGTHDEVY